MLKMEFGKYCTNWVCTKRRPITVQKNMICQSNRRGRGRLRRMMRKMLSSMNGENDQISSLSTAQVRNWPARKPESTSKGIAAHSPCSRAGMAISTPPSDPAQRPPITPSRRAVSKLMSPAWKLFEKIRAQTPTMIGSPNQSTRYSFCWKVRSSRNKRLLNSLERTRLLDTAAATPSLNSKLKRMSRCSMEFVSSDLPESLCDDQERPRKL